MAGIAGFIFILQWFKNQNKIIEINPNVIARPAGNRNIAERDEDFLDAVEGYLDRRIKEFKNESKRNHK